MYLIQEVYMKEILNRKLTNNEIRSAIAFCRTLKNKYWRLREEHKAVLLASIEAQAKLTEEEIDKKSLLAIIKIMCNYMRAHSLYVYYRDSLSVLLVKQNGNINNSNSKD